MYFIFFDPDPRPEKIDIVNLMIENGADECILNSPDAHKYEHYGFIPL